MDVVIFSRPTRVFSAIDTPRLYDRDSVGKSQRIVILAIGMRHYDLPNRSHFKPGASV
jgi:hypothetical protein